jgi:hypothetical protein
MINPSTWKVVRWPKRQQALLVVVVDTEAEFNWKGPSRRALGVKSTRHLAKAQSIFERNGIRPTFVLDYPISSQPEGYEPIRDIAESGGCEIGAHLQPWDNPPFTEFVTERNSYPGNLPARLEYAKLERLTEIIARNIGVRPRIYKAGRYGVGCHTADAMRRLGYEIDVSVLPGTDLSHNLGPDFSRCDAHPYWFGEDQSLFEVPLSVGFSGLLAAHGRQIHRYLATPRLSAWHLPGILARLGLLERVILTPEGVEFEELKRLTLSMFRRGYRVFSLTYHSPSLLPGNTPYVRDERQLDEFLDRIARFIDFFKGELCGRPATPFEVRAEATAACETTAAAAALAPRSA